MLIDNQQRNLSLLGCLYCFITWLLWSDAVLAWHTSIPPYTILGYVLADDETPIEGISVVVTLGYRDFGNTTTNAKGYYSIKRVLRNSDFGEELGLQAGNNSGKVRVIPKVVNQVNKTKTYFHYINFIGDDIVEGKLWRLGGKFWRLGHWMPIYLTVAIIVVMFGIYAMVLKPLRRKLAKQKITSGQTTQKRKHRKRKR